MRRYEVMLSVLALVSGCGNNESPAMEKSRNENVGQCPEPISYDTRLKDIVGKAVTIRGYLLEAQVKGYPELWEDRSRSRSITVLFPSKFDKSSILNRRMIITGTVTEVNPPPPSPPNSIPNQGNTQKIYAIKSDSIREDQ